MNSNKRSSLENHSPRSENRQKHSVSRSNKTTRTSYSATDDDEIFLKDISKEMNKINNERDSKIEKLTTSVEVFIRDRRRNRQDTKRQQVVSEAEQLLDQLRMMLGRPPLYQRVVQMERDSPAYQQRLGGDPQTTDGFGNVMMTPVPTPTNIGYPSLESIEQGTVGMERDSRAGPRYDNSTKTPVSSVNDRMISERTPTKSGHRSMEVSEQGTVGMERGSRADPRYDNSTKTPVSSVNDRMISERTPTKSGHRSMEVSEQGTGSMERGSRADPRYDNSTKTPVSSVNDRMISERTPTKSGHRSMEVSEQNTLEAACSRRLCLLLLGSAGNGKSSIGNSILGKDEFKTSSSVNSSSPRIAIGCAQVGDQTVQVVDGPSILDLRGNDQDFMEQVVIAMEKSLTLCDYAFSAIVIVLRFGVRFTKQEVDTIKLIKSVLGGNVIKDYGICAVSCGDNFELAVEESREDGQELTFEGWCREQTGEVKALFEECSFRCVLFDNRTKDVDKKSFQRLALLKMVNPMMTYSKEEFLKAEGSLRELLATEALIPDLERQTQQLIDNTRSDMQQISEDDSLQYNTHMESLLQRLTDHEATLHVIGLSSPNLNQLLISLKVLKSEIGSKISHRRQMEFNRRLVTPSFSSHPSIPPPLPTNDRYENDVDFDGWASSQGIEPRAWNYAPMSSSAWYTEQSGPMKVPTAQGHTEGISVWVKEKWDRIIEYIKQKYNGT